MASNFNEERESSLEYSGSNSNNWNERSFSKSSNRLLKEISNYADGVDLIQLLELLHRIHPEYGTIGSRIESSITSEIGQYQKLLQFLKKSDEVLKLSKFTSDQWAEEILSILIIPKDPPIINGRLFLIAALLSNFSEVFSKLNRSWELQKLSIDLLEKLEDELVSNAKISFYSLLTKKGENLLNILKNPLSEDPEDVIENSIIDTNNLSDGPAKEDSLSRKALAKYLAKRLRHIYNRDIDMGKNGSFFMHIDGAWGSGKSTLLGFLEDELEKSVSDDQKPRSGKISDGKWVIVNFNAWENQRLDPPWWFLMKTFYTEAKNSLKPDLNKFGPPEYLKQDKKRIRQLIWSEYLWRFKSGSSYLVVAGITFILFIFSLAFGAFNQAIFEKLPIVQLLTFVGFLWSLAKAFNSGLASGSAKAAQKFIEENGKDPLQEIAEHFNHQINIIGYPVAIFIDDLDRCNIEYGIRLLEGLQTIFKKAGVVYVIAADRKWLSTMYEHQYEKFASVIEKPSKPFGLVFLDKIFQLIVELPDISSAQKKIYWDNLLNIRIDPNDEASFSERMAVQKKIQSAGSNANKMEMANNKRSSPQLQQMVREEVLGELSIQEEEKNLEHKLQQFIDLIEPNPRAMKRLINDVSTAKAIAFLYNQEVDENKLILWTILKLQHPLLAEYFLNNPQKIDQVFDYIKLEEPFSGNIDFDILISNPNVKKLFYHTIGGLKYKLNTEFLLKLKFQSALPIA